MRKIVVQGGVGFIRRVIAVVVLPILLVSPPPASYAKDIGDPSVAPPQYQSIVGGAAADHGAQPWMVALLRQYADIEIPASERQFCGGVLIAPTWVITAAHCLSATNAASIELAIGVTDLDTSDFTAGCAGISQDQPSPNSACHSPPPVRCATS
ncbi:MAG: trypsin-like serine protease [Pseudohongiellaceae bacterium]